MKIFFRSYTIPHQEHLGIYYWGFLYFQESDTWQEFTLTDAVVEKITQKIKELFGKTASVDVILSSFSNNHHLRVSFNSQEDNDYFAVLTTNGLDL